MKNQDDYKSGWTQKTINPKTGKECSGGAARNLRLAQAGGANSIQVMATVKAMQSVQPIVEQQQTQIKHQQKQIDSLTKTLEKAINFVNKDRSK